MAQLKDLIVNGASRFLNTIFTNNINTTGTLGVLGKIDISKEDSGITSTDTTYGLNILSASNSYLHVGHNNNSSFIGTTGTDIIIRPKCTVSSNVLSSGYGFAIHSNETDLETQIIPSISDNSYSSYIHSIGTINKPWTKLFLNKTNSAKRYNTGIIFSDGSYPGTLINMSSVNSDGYFGIYTRSGHITLCTDCTVDTTNQQLIPSNGVLITSTACSARATGYNLGTSSIPWKEAYIDKGMINGSNTDYNLYVNGTTQFNIGSSDGVAQKKFIIYGNNRFTSIGGSGIQAYSGTVAAPTSGILYINYAGGTVDIGNNKVTITGTETTCNQDLILKATNTDSPALVFNRTNSGYVDWRILCTAGKLSFQSATDGTTWTERAYFASQSGDLNLHNLTANGYITLSGTTADTATIAFSRTNNPNYITAPGNASISFCVNDTKSAANSIAVETNGIYPGTSNTFNLGSATRTWKQACIDKVMINGSNADYNLYVNGISYFNIGTNDSAAWKRFVINGNSEFLSIGAAGIQAYKGTPSNTSTIDANNQPPLYLNFNGGTVQVGGASGAQASAIVKGDITASHFLSTHTSGGSSEFRVTYGSTVDMWMGIGTADTNHGLYDAKASKWMVVADTSGNVTLNGNATTATTATTANYALSLSQCHRIGSTGTQFKFLEKIIEPGAANTLTMIILYVSTYNDNIWGLFKVYFYPVSGSEKCKVTWLGKSKGMTPDRLSYTWELNADDSKYHLCLYLKKTNSSNYKQVFYLLSSLNRGGAVVPVNSSEWVNVAPTATEQTNMVNSSPSEADLATGANITTTAKAVAYYTDANGTFGSDSGVTIDTTNHVLKGAAWNDYAEYRQSEIKEPGRVITEIGNDQLRLTTARLERGCEIISDTFGFAIGETNDCQTPIAASGRVLAYPYESREEFASHIGWPVCSGPNGTVSIMTEEEEEKYPSRIIGTISAVPDYEIWGSGNVQVNGRVWIRIK